MQHSRIALRVVLKWDMKVTAVVDGHSGTQTHLGLFILERHNDTL